MTKVIVYLDESGNGNPKDPLVICGIAVEDDFVVDFRDRIKTAYLRTLAHPSFRDAADRDRFKQEGFHRSLDMPEVMVEFIRILKSTNVYKAFLIATDRSTLKSPGGDTPMDEVDQMVEMYVRLGGVLRRQFRAAPSIALVVERNEPLAPRMADIHDRINSQRNSHGRRLPPVTVGQADKNPDSILSAADGLAHVAAAWLKKQRTTSGKDFEYRTYVDTEAAISWFCSMEDGVISTRRVRHSEVKSSGAGAESVPLAIPHASASEQLLSTRSRAPAPLDPGLVANIDTFAAHLHAETADLTRFAAQVTGSRHYSVKRILSGKRARLVVRPNLVYGTVSKELSRLLSGTTSYQAPPHVFGFVRGRSIREHARLHLAKECVLRLDINRFFESIDRSCVIAALETDGVAPDVAQVIANLTAPQGHLATGLSTSPHLSNIVFQSTDQALLELSQTLGLTFSRYVDDLIFSGSIDDEKADQIRGVLSAHGWEINESKTRFMRRGHAQYVTGLSVSDHRTPHAPRRLKRLMRWRLQKIEKYGYERYMREFGGSKLGHYPSHLRGTARYLYAQEPGLDSGFLKRWDDALPVSWYEDEHADYVYEGDEDEW